MSLRIKRLPRYIHRVPGMTIEPDMRGRVNVRTRYTHNRDQSKFYYADQTGSSVTELRKRIWVSQHECKAQVPYVVIS